MLERVFSSKNRALDNWFYRRGTFCSNCNFTVQRWVSFSVIFFCFENSTILLLPGFLMVAQDPTNVLDCCLRDAETPGVSSISASHLEKSSWKVQPLVTFSILFTLAGPASRWLLEVIVWGSFKQSTEALRLPLAEKSFNLEFHWSLPLHALLYSFSWLRPEVGDVEIVPGCRISNDNQLGVFTRELKEWQRKVWPLFTVSPGMIILTDLMSGKYTWC